MLSEKTKILLKENPIVQIIVNRILEEKDHTMFNIFGNDGCGYSCCGVWSTNIYLDKFNDHDVSKVISEIGDDLFDDKFVGRSGHLYFLKGEEWHGVCTNYNVELRKELKNIIN